MWVELFKTLNIKTEHVDFMTNYCNHIMSINNFDINDYKLTMSIVILKDLLENNIKLSISYEPLETVLIYKSKYLKEPILDFYHINEISTFLKKYFNGRKLKVYNLIQYICIEKDEIKIYSNILFNDRLKKINRTK